MKLPLEREGAPTKFRDWVGPATLRMQCTLYSYAFDTMDDGLLHYPHFSLADCNCIVEISAWKCRPKASSMDRRVVELEFLDHHLGEV